MKNRRGERVVVLTFNDIYDLEPATDGTRGGFAALCGLIAEERRRALDDPEDPAGAVIVCCCGDFMSAEPTLSGSAADDAGRHMVPLLAAAGVTHVVPGNHEFDRGTRPCALRSSESSFCWLCANVRAPPSSDGGDRPFGAGVDMDTVTTVRGTRIGLVGFCTPRAPLLSAAGDGGAVFVDPVDAAANVLPFDCDPGEGRERGDRLDALVALTHMDLSEDVHLAASCNGRMDLIVGGHDHEPIVHRTDVGPPIVKCGCDARWLGRIVLRIDQSHSDCTPSGVTVESIDLLANDATAARDTSTEKHVIDFLRDLHSERRVARVSDDVRASGIDDPLGRDPLTVLCALPHRLSSVGPREGPCPFADVVCDVLRDAADVDLFLIHAGLLRKGRIYEAGYALTAGDAHAELPFPSRCAARLVPGHSLVDALEHGLGMIGRPDATGSVGRESRGLLHVSSAWRYAYDPARPEGERITGVWCGGEPIDGERVYRVGMPRYLSLGGDGFAMLAGHDQSPSSAADVILCRLFVDGITPAHLAASLSLDSHRITRTG